VAYNASSGSRLWVARYSGGAARAVAVSPDGSHVYVTGTSTRPGAKGYATVAYSAATGSTAWADTYSPGNGQAASLAVSPNGSALYVTGTTGRYGQQSFTTVGYAAATGSTLWVTRYTGLGHNSATAMAISKDGAELAVTGQGKARTGHQAYATVAYDTASGAQLWARHYEGPYGFGLGEAIGISPDRSKVFVTGYVNGTPGSLYYGTLAYAATTGTTLWRKLYKGPAQSSNQAMALAINPDGTALFVTGGSNQNTYGPAATITLAYQP
jgi:DNA-binding beta-propeller fold protein YncE